MSDTVLIANRVTPTGSGRWLVYAEGRACPVVLLDELPDAPVVVVETDVTVYVDPDVVETVVDPVFFAPGWRFPVLAAA